MSNIKVEHPKLKTPISLMIDDSNLLNADIFFNYLKKLSNLRRKYDLKGKMSITPWLKEFGPIDSKKDPPVPYKKLRKIVKYINKYINPYMDINPEMLTHGRAVNLKTGELLPVSEWEWSRKQSVKTLTGYISRAIKILRNIGIKSNGVTSPCDFGRGNEKRYANAVLNSELRINKRNFAWFFLSSSNKSGYVTPKILYMSKDKKKASLDIVSSYNDWLLDEIVKRKIIQPNRIGLLADKYISKDGKKGRLARLLKNKSYVVFHTHWWALHNKGTNNGFKVYELILSRIKKYFGNNMLWMKCSDLCKYYVISKIAKVKINKIKDIMRVIVNSPFKCDDFTFSVKTKENIKKLFIGDKILLKVNKFNLFGENTWIQMKNKIVVCCKI